MKKLLVLALIVVASLVTTAAYSQVHVDVQLERDYPGYQYYNYPKWHGHYKDRVYYEHYHRTFEKRYHAYYHDRNFDHERFEREQHWHH